LLVICPWSFVIGCWAGKPRPYTPIADCRLPKNYSKAAYCPLEADY